jgi:F-type H+-transporting ATPase subunit epsilon
LKKRWPKLNNWRRVEDLKAYFHRKDAKGAKKAKLLKLGRFSLRTLRLCGGYCGFGFLQLNCLGRFIMEKTIKLDVVTPERKTISQDVDEVVLPAAEGSMGVLPGHMAMVVALKPGMLKILSQGQEMIYAIGGGWAEVTPTKVVVLADTAEPAEDINLEAAKQEREKALAQLKQSIHGDELTAAEISLKKAVAGLQVGEIIRRRKSGGRS